MELRSTATKGRSTLCILLVLALLPWACAQGAQDYRTLREGDQCEEVRVMQTALNALGYAAGKADGKFGKATLEAVIKFQTDQRLEADGVAGSKTLQRLFELYAASLGLSPQTGTPTPKSPQTSTPTPAPVYTERTPAYVQTKSGPLNLRDQPKSGAVILARIPNGAAVTVLQTNDIWCIVEYDRLVGYVKRTYLRFDGQAPLQPAATPAPTATPSPTATPQPFNQGTRAQVSTTGGHLNLRKEPKSGTRVIGTIPNGTWLTVSQNLGTWCIVTYEGVLGYVKTTYLRFGTEPAPVATPTPTPTFAPIVTPTPPLNPSNVWARVTSSGSLHLRESASRDSRSLASIPGDTLINVTANYGTWCAVIYGSLLGFVMTEYLDFNIHTPPPSSSPSPSPSPSPSATPAPTPEDTTLKLGSQGEAVSRMQNRLVQLGYTCAITGTFDNETHKAVVEFQKLNGLSADGIAGPVTLTALYGSDAKGAGTAPPALDTDKGLMSGPPKSSVKLLHWFNEIKPSLKTGATLQIYDPATGLGWKLRVYSRGRHCDSEPLTLLDTQIMYRAFGNKNTWTPKPVYVNLPDGRWTLATMHNVAHLSGSIKENGFDGHLCVHFLRDMEECAANDPNYGVQHQKRIRAAWLSMTGIVVE